MKILVTGGAGYIGSHAVKALQTGGHDVIVVDNLSRGHRAAVRDKTPLIVHELRDTAHITEVMKWQQTDCVMHFAALAYVGESVDQPLRYYQNNTADAVSLLIAMQNAGVNKLVFSSTCATYGEPGPDQIPIAETCPQAPINPYGRSKLFVEHVVRDLTHANPDFGCAFLRYFNVAGCDREGELGEWHVPETHLIPIILEAALGKRSHVEIYGTDYETPDGTCIRDYVHVEDLAAAHIAAMNALRPGEPLIYNLGIGNGYSVREVIDAAGRVVGKPIPTKEGPRRPGDPPTLYADPSKIQRELGWKAQITGIDEIIESAWKWFSNHPDGYDRFD